MQSRIQNIFIIILVILNLVCLGMLFSDRGSFLRPKHKPGAKQSFLAQELDFTPAQNKQFSSLQDTHFVEIRTLQDQKRKLMDQFFNEWETQSKITAIADSVGNLQTRIELTTHSHFEAVRAICTEAQKERFDQVIREAMRPGPRQGRPRPPRQ